MWWSQLSLSGKDVGLQSNAICRVGVYVGTRSPVEFGFISLGDYCTQGLINYAAGKGVGISW